MPDQHPNRAPFSGTLTYVDRLSDRPPGGARGRRVILTRAAAEESLPTLIGMAVNYSPDWDAHDARRKVGVITDAFLEEDRIELRGYIFALDFPDFMRWLADPQNKMGMSYELHDAHVLDMRNSVWTIIRLTFIGAAVILHEKASYQNTRFELDDQMVPAIAAATQEKAT